VAVGMEVGKRVSTSPSRSSERASRSGERAGARPGAVWTVPAFIYFGIFALAPMVLVVVLSFASWNGVSAIRFIGLGNWTRLVNDPQIAKSLVITGELTLGTWIVQQVLGMAIGVWAAGRQRFRAVLSSIFFLPLVFSGAAIAIVWLVLLDPNFGIVSWLGPTLGLRSFDPLGSPHGALLMVILVGSWQFVPFNTLLYQGAARGIPTVLYDAAAIDGCTGARQLLHVTLPHLRNTMVTSSVINIVGSLTAIEGVLILTQGGPGTATYSLPYYMYNEGFVGNALGYGSAIAVIVVLLASVFAFLLVRVTGYARMRSTLEGL